MDKEQTRLTKKQKATIKVAYKKAKKAFTNMASWGGKKFNVTPKKIMSLESLSTQDSYTTDGESPGRDKTKFTIPLSLVAGVGYNVQSEINFWRNQIGNINYLYVGGKKLFHQKFRLVSVNTSDQKFTGKGFALQANLTLEFEEHRKTAKKSNTANKTATTKSSVKSTGPTGSTSTDFTWPVPGHKRISSEYGWRRCPFHGREKHSGIDIPASSGTAIVAAQGGTVVMSGRNGSYGNCIIISHGNNTYSLYGHCSSLLVKKGASVSKKQRIAKVGSTGNSTGPHLHFEVRKGGNNHSKNTNPHAYLK